MRSVSRFIASLLCFLLVVASLLTAQSGTTSLRGTVTDPSSATVSGATVTLSSPERGISRSVKSARLRPNMNFFNCSRGSTN